MAELIADETMTIRDASGLDVGHVDHYSSIGHVGHVEWYTSTVVVDGLTRSALIDDQGHVSIDRTFDDIAEELNS